MFYLNIFQAREVPGLTIFRSSATVYFANAELYLDALKEKVCFLSDDKINFRAATDNLIMF